MRPGALAAVLGILTLACARQSPRQAREVRVAAASDLQYLLREVVDSFHAANPGIRLAVTYGSSGNFYSQLRNQAPFDLYLSADLDYPRRLADSGYALPNSLFRYAIGEVVVWVPAASPLDLDRLGVQALLDPSVRRIAMANPRHAPYGRAAEAALRTLGVYAAVERKLVLGESVSQTAQFVQSGAADVGLIALSLAAAPAMRAKGRAWRVPLDAYPRLEQGGVVLRWARDTAAALALRDELLGPRGRALLTRHGFMIPGG